MSSIRVFVDSSVLFPAVFSETGRARDLLQAGLRGRVSLIVSPLVLQETGRNLAAKAPEVLPTFQAVRPRLISSDDYPSEHLIREVARIVAAKDVPIVAAAIQSEATYLATYDRRHLLALRDEIKDHFNLVVATPEEILLLVQ